MQQQHAIDFGNRALGQFFVDAVQRVARLEGDDVGMPVGFQTVAHLRRRQAQRHEIVVARQLKHLQPPGNVELAPTLHLGDQRVTQVERAEDFERGFVQIPTVLFLDAS